MERKAEKKGYNLKEHKLGLITAGTFGVLALAVGWGAAAAILLGGAGYLGAEQIDRRLKK